MDIRRHGVFKSLKKIRKKMGKFSKIYLTIDIDVVEVVPGLDDSKIAVFAARKIIMECWGHYYRKRLNQ